MEDVEDAKHQTDVKARGAVDLRAAPRLARSPLQRLELERSHDERDHGYAIIVPKSGIPRIDRACSYGFVLLPKLGLSLLVLLAGSGVVLHSKSDFALVLNSVAVA